MYNRRSPLSTIPALLTAIGLGLCGYYGTEWLQLEDYSEADIMASVEVNLALDLQRRGPHLQPDEAGMQRLREIVQAEVEGDIRREREKIQLRFGVGLIALVLGAGNLLTAKLMRRD